MLWGAIDIPRSSIGILRNLLEGSTSLWEPKEYLLEFNRNTLESSGGVDKLVRAIGITREFNWTGSTRLWNP